MRHYLSLRRAVSQREGETKEKKDEINNIQTTPTANAWPLPYYYQLVGRLGTTNCPAPSPNPTIPWSNRKVWPVESDAYSKDQSVDSQNYGKN